MSDHKREDPTETERWERDKQATEPGKPKGEATEGSMTNPLIDIERASVELRLSGGVTYIVEFQNAVVPLRGQLNIEVEPVEGPSDGGYRTFVSGPMLGDLTLSGFVKSAVRITAPAAMEQS